MTKLPHNLQLQDNWAILAFKSRSDISNIKVSITDYVTDVHLYDIAVGINLLASSLVTAMNLQNNISTVYIFEKESNNGSNFYRVSFSRCIATHYHELIS